MDYFTKWVEAYALPNQEAVTVADVIVKELVSRFGVPLELHSDQGRNFESAIFSRICETLGIHKTRTTPLHPQSDGMVERMNRTMGKYLSKVVSDHQRDWDQYLHLFLLAYRSSINETTGQTPASVMFGRELRLPCDLQFGFRPQEDVVGEDYVSNLRRRMDEIHDKVRSNILSASERMKSRYDIKADKGGYQPGDLVWLYNPKRRRGYSPKLQSPWEGPYEVVTRINDVIYRIKKQPKGKLKVVHINRLAPYNGNNEEAQEGSLQNVTTIKGQNEGLQDDCNATNQYSRTKVVYKDLFTVPKDYALAHCVAEDLGMSRGIATVFRKKFGGIEELELQRPSVGKALHLQHGDQDLFYLVTKGRSPEKPSYRTLRETLVNLREQVLQMGIEKIAIPKLGCGYDSLNWVYVRRILEEVFKNTGVDILVCVYNPWSSKEKRTDLGSLPSESIRQSSRRAVLGQNSLKEGVMLWAGRRNKQSGGNNEEGSP